MCTYFLLFHHRGGRGGGPGGRGPGPGGPGCHGGRGPGGPGCHGGRGPGCYGGGNNHQNQNGIIGCRLSN